MRNCAGLLFFLFWFFIVSAQPDTTQKIIKGRTNSVAQQQKPYVILISADGFRYDYAEKHQAMNLLALSANGVRAASMIPSYPTLTFPNHYSIVTGLYPSHHGLANNYFYDQRLRKSYSMYDRKIVEDGRWYGGTPLWVLAEKQQMLSAAFYWVGSEADIQKTRPTYYYRYVDSIPIDRRIAIVVGWLQLPPERRPHFISFYMSVVDHQGHKYGPDAPQTGEAVRWVDSTVQKLVLAVSKTGLPVNFIFLSDHGMTAVDTIHTLSMPAAVDTKKFIIPRSMEMVELYAKNKKDILPTYDKLKKEEKGFTAYLKTNMPPHLRYGSKDDIMNRIGDILLIPTWPQVFKFSDDKQNPGVHGFDPALVKDMDATFFAWGPAFKTAHVESFENVNVFPVITRILGLHFTGNIDATQDLADKVLK